MVIAIIGILASIVLVSLGSARTKAKDAAIKVNLSGLRAGAGIFASENNESYNGFCTVVGGDVDIVENALPADVSLVCRSQDDNWAACVQLLEKESDYFCVDSNDSARQITGTCDEAAITGAAGNYVCP